MKKIQFHLPRLKAKSVLFFVLFIVLYLLLGAALPYLKKPEVSETYRQNFSAESFYSDAISCDRAAVLEENGQALTERICLIEQAKESLILSTFDFHSDISGKQMIASLLAAAERGVKVKVLLDGFNSLLSIEGNPYFFALASHENAEIRIYNQLNPLTPWKGMSRMHDKYVIADDLAYILGGRNTFDYFLGAQEGYKNHDRDVLVYNTGGADSSVYTLIDYFENIWELEFCRVWKPADRRLESADTKEAKEELNEIYKQIKAEYELCFETPDYEKKTVPANKISLLSNPTGLYSKEPWVFYGLSELMAQAKERVWIHTPYIICDKMMYQSFAEICSKEAEVTLMTNSAQNNGNPFGATDYVLHKDEILATGLKVLEYNGGVSYHGKSVLIDDDISIIGSFNMDMKSVYQDTELMLVIHSKELNEQLSGYMGVFHEDSDAAELQENRSAELFDGISVKRKVERFFIRIIDPVIRFLL